MSTVSEVTALESRAVESPSGSAMETESVSRSAVAFRLAVVAFVITRIWMLIFLVPISTDRQIYFEYAVRGVDLGERAFVDYAIEYPPLGYWAMAAPRIVVKDHLTRQSMQNRELLYGEYGRYSLLFRFEMAILDIVTFVLFVGLIRRRLPEFVSAAAWGYVGCTTALAHVMYDRLDVGLAAILVLWLFLRSRLPPTGGGFWTNLLSYAVLGLSIAYKLVGIVAVPFVLLSDLQSTRGSFGRRCAVAGCYLLTTLLVAAGPFLAHAPYAGTKSLGFLEYHGARGIEIASTYGTGLLVARQFGYPVETKVDYGSANLASSWSPFLTRISPFVLLAALAVLGLRCLLRGRDFDRADGDRAGALALVVTLLLSKVLSAQYLVFGFPLILFCASTMSATGFQRTMLLAFATAILTTVVFPYLWFPYVVETDTTNPYPLVPNLHVLPVSLLILRNVLFVGLVAVLLRSPRRWGET